MPDRMRLAVVGLGWWATTGHIPAYETVPDIEIVAVSDVVREKLDCVSEKFGISNMYHDYGQMLEREKPDIVSVTTPPSTHARIAIDAAEHGANVFVEKPMAPSLEEVDRMISAAKKNNVKLAVAENYRYLPEIVMAKDKLEKEIIGRTFSIKFEDFIWWTYPGRYMTSANRFVIQEQAVHYVDVIRWLSDSDAKFVHAITRNKPSLHTKGENFAILTIEFENGIVGVVEESYCSKGRQYGLRGTIDGTDGSIALNWKWPIALYSDREQVRGWLFPDVEGEYPFLRKGVFSGPFEWPMANLSRGTGEAVRTFIKAIREDTEAPTSGDDNRKTMEIITAAYESAEKHKVIEL